MKLNIERFAADAFTISVKVIDYKYNGKGEMMSCKVRIESNYNIDSIYDIDDLGSENWAYSYWDQHRSESVPDYSSNAPYIERVFTSLDDITGVHIQTYDINSGNNKYISYLFNIVEQENASTTYLTKTSATAVLKGNVLNSLNTYDYNNAPSVAAVRNYFESSAVLHQSDIENIVSQAVSAALLAGHPVGSIEVNVSGDNPGTYLGGTWESFGTGKTLVGIDASQTEFNTIEKTGGEKTHTLTTNEIPAHTHGSKSLVGTWANWGEGSGQVSRTANGYKVTGIVSAVGDNNQYGWGTNTGRDQDNTSLKIDATHEHNSVGGGQAHNNLQPYITVYFWKRIS